MAPAFPLHLCILLLAPVELGLIDWAASGVILGPGVSQAVWTQLLGQPIIKAVHTGMFRLLPGRKSSDLGPVYFGFTFSSVCTKLARDSLAIPFSLLARSYLELPAQWSDGGVEIDELDKISLLFSSWVISLPWSRKPSSNSQQCLRTHSTKLCQKLCRKNKTGSEQNKKVLSSCSK